MASNSMLIPSPRPKINLGFPNGHRNELLFISPRRTFPFYCSGQRGEIFPFGTFCIYSRRLPLKRLSVTAAAASGGSYAGRGASSRRVYRESRAQAPPAPVKEILNVILPAGAFFVATFVLWKLVEKILIPKPTNSVPKENKAAAQGVTWSFASGTNLSSPFGAKIERESKIKLNDFAKELRSYRSVDLSGRNFGDDGLIFLAESLAYNQTAEEVNFAANGITADGIKAFDGILQSNIALKVLNLSGNVIGDEGVKSLCDILSNNAGIQMLQLSSASIGDEGAKAIVEMIKKNSTLRFIELSNSLIEYSGFSGLAGALLENKTIHSICLNGNYDGPLGAAALAKGLEGNKSLEELFLQGNLIGDEGVRALISGLLLHKGKLTTLDLANNSISAKGAFHVAEYVKNSKSLLSLSLYMNDIGDEVEIDPFGEKYHNVSKYLLPESKGGNNIHTKGIIEIARVLKDNSVISTLEVGYNPIGPEGAKALAEVLKFHGNVKHLMLGWCQIGVNGVEYIADMLRYNNTISSLDLRANGLGDEGAACLARSLKVVNEALTSLKLGFNEIRDEGAFAIARALKANEDVRLTSLNLMNNFLTKLGQSAITDAKDHVCEINERELDVVF